MKYHIPEANYQTILKKKDQLARKATKMDLPFVFNELGSYNQEMIDDRGHKYYLRYYVVNIEFNLVRPGYAVIGMVEYHNAGNLVVNFDTCEGVDNTIPERYWNCDMYCEHCKTHRARNKLFIVKNLDTGECKAVGSSCVQEFTGVLNEQMLSTYQYIREVLDRCATLDWNNPGTRYMDLEDFLLAADYFVRHYGYVRTSETLSTRERTMNYSLGIVDDEESYEVDKYILDPENIQRVKAMIEYAKTLDSKYNDFEHNMFIIANCGVVDNQTAGIAAYLPKLYDRHLEDLKRKESENEPSNEFSQEYAGEVGDVVDVDVAGMDMITSYVDSYGYLHFMYRIVDTMNRVLIWTTSKNLLLDDEEYITKVKKIRGRVKDHNTFKGVNQTVLTRCRVTFD